MKIKVINNKLQIGCLMMKNMKNNHITLLTEKEIKNKTLSKIEKLNNNVLFIKVKDTKNIKFKFSKIKKFKKIKKVYLFE